jgi:RNA polymerase sigma-70 factor (sigma-E family)
VRARDEADFAQFVQGTSARLFRSAYALCGDYQLAEDAVQAAFASAYVSWRRVRNADNPEAYVRRILTNQVLSWWRRKGSRAEWPEATPPETGRVDSPEDQLVDSDLVWQAIGTLPPRQRAVIVLRYYEDLSEREIAKTLGIQPGTVKSQASAALTTLRRLIGRQIFVENGEAR